MNAVNPIHVIIESIAKAPHSLVDVLSAFLTPVIAILAIIIAYQQYRINRLRSQHELYERRFRVYKAVQSFLSQIVQEVKIDLPRCFQFYAETSESVFLFKKSVQEFIEQVFKRAIELHSLHEEMQKSAAAQGERAKEKAQLIKWFYEQLEESKKLFNKQMGIK